MTAATLSDSTSTSTMLASIVDKIQRGKEEVVESDLEQIRSLLCPTGRQSIPYLDRTFLTGTAESPPPGNATLVRYVGMVQDMLDPEYYLSEMNGIKTHYRDYYYDTSKSMAEEEDILASHKLAERQPLMVVPIPFFSEWISQLSAFSQKETLSLQETTIRDGFLIKRQREEETASPSAPLKRKPLTPDTSIEEDSLEAPTPPKQSEETVNGARNATSPVESTPDWWPAGCMGTDAQQCPVLAKLYYELDETAGRRRLRLNDVVEVVGLLSVDPMEADFRQSGGANAPEGSFHPDEWLDRTALPPPSLLPRLHVLTHKTLDMDELLVKEQNEPHSDAMEEDTGPARPQGDDDNDRKQFIQLLADSVFEGDQVAAEAVLLALLSKAEREKLSEDAWVPIKTPTETTLGCASLNLILPDEASCTRTYHRLVKVLRDIVPAVGSLELERESLGTAIVSPAKTEDGRLVRSPLQLPRGAALVINESPLTAGPVSARGQETLQALSSLTGNHSVPYRFEGMMKYNFEADCRVIVLSSRNKVSARNAGSASSPGSKLLPCTLRMAISVKNEGNPSVTENELESMRLYLARCRCNTPTGGVARNEGSSNLPFAKQVLDCAQNDFIERRVEHRAKVERKEAVASAEVGEEDFHRWLTIARLQARSQSLSGVEVQNWKDALRLDDQMKN